MRAPAQSSSQPAAVHRWRGVGLVGLAVLASGALGCRREPPPVEVSVETPLAGPRAIAFDPPLGAGDVDPARTSLTVTFDREMDRQGWAWVIENASSSPELGASRFDESGRANTVEARLEPERTYVVWVNSPEYSYFRDLTGASAAPVRWSFSTRGGPASGGSTAIAALATHRTGAPQVVAFEPANGAAGVDPALAELKATFDRPMSEGWSWVTEGADSFPETTGEARLSPDGRAAILPVRLAPGRSYVIWLNSQQYRFFRDRAGVELAPVRWVFSTALRP